MKMPPQKPVGNGYYGYEDLSHLPGHNDNSVSIPTPNNADNQTPENNENDFEEYLWMENEEEFDKQVMQQLEEEELMEQCIEAMLEEEHQHPSTEPVNRTSMRNENIEENSGIMNLVENFKLVIVDVAKSTLNPLAAEFVPDNQNMQLPRSTE